jgi:hypothetical protein
MQRERAAGQLLKPLELTDAAAARTRIDPASIVSCEALSSSCWVAGLRRQRRYQFVGSWLSI